MQLKEGFLDIKCTPNSLGEIVNYEDLWSQRLEILVQRILGEVLCLHPLQAHQVILVKVALGKNIVKRHWLLVIKNADVRSHIHRLISSHYSFKQNHSF